MRTLANLVSFSMLSLVALGAAIVIMLQQQLKINDFIEQIEVLKAEKLKLEQEIGDAPTTIAMQENIIAEKNKELQAAFAKNYELSVEIYKLKVQITGIKIIQWSSPLLQLLPFGIWLVANRIIKEPHRTLKVDIPNDENIVTVRMTREQASEYSKWRRNERR